MTEPCRTKCGTEIDYVREEFSDRVFFSIPTETDGTIHNCVNLQLAEFDLVSKTWREKNGGIKEIDVKEKLPELPPDLHKIRLIKASSEVLQRVKEPFDPATVFLDYESRAGYRHDLYEFHIDVLYNLEDEIVSPEDRSNLRIVIGHFLNKLFFNMEMEPTEKYSIITKKLGSVFSTLELLGLFYQIDGFYLDAKRCYEIQYRLLKATLQKLENGSRSIATLKGKITIESETGSHQYQAIAEEYNESLRKAKSDMEHTKAMIDEIQDRIETTEATEPGVEKKKGWWFTGWTGDLADYAKKVRKDQYQDDDTVSEKKETESSQHYDRKQTLYEIQTFEKDVLRPTTRKQFKTETELNDELKKLSWRFGFTSRGTLFEKAQSRRKQDEESVLPTDDPMNVGLLRHLDIGDLVDIIKSKLGTTFKREIDWDVKEIIKHRNRLSHSQDFPEKELMFTNVIIVAKIGRIKPFFENLDRR